MSELLLQASMGLSHIYHDIRIDACRLIALLLSLAPSSVVGVWPKPGDHRILDGLRLVAGIGGRAGEGGQSGLNLLPRSKLVILDTLLAFVKAGFGKQGLYRAAAAGARGAGAKDLRLPGGMFDSFAGRYPCVGRLDGKGKAREVVPIARIGEDAQGRGQLFDGWLVQAWEAVSVLEDAGMWDLSAVGKQVEESGESVGQALSVSRHHSRKGFG